MNIGLCGAIRLVSWGSICFTYELPFEDQLNNNNNCFTVGELFCFQ